MRVEVPTCYPQDPLRSHEKTIAEASTTDDRSLDGSNYQDARVRSAVSSTSNILHPGESTTRSKCIERDIKVLALCARNSKTAEQKHGKL